MSLKRPLLKDTEYNRKMAEILDSKGYISKYEYEDKGVRISTFKKAIEGY